MKMLSWPWRRRKLTYEQFLTEYRANFWAGFTTGAGREPTDQERAQKEREWAQMRTSR